MVEDTKVNSGGGNRNKTIEKSPNAFNLNKKTGYLLRYPDHSR